MNLGCHNAIDGLQQLKRRLQVICFFHIHDHLDQGVTVADDRLQPRAVGLMQVKSASKAAYVVVGYMSLQGEQALYQRAVCTCLGEPKMNVTRIGVGVTAYSWHNLFEGGIEVQPSAELDEAILCRDLELAASM